MTSSLGEIQTAAKLRDIVTSIAVTTVDKLRPAEKIGKVYSIDFERSVAKIYFPGESIDSLIEARFAADKIPTEEMITTFATAGYDAVGNIVRVAGGPGSYYISDYVSGIPAIDPSARALVVTNTVVINQNVDIATTTANNASVTASAASVAVAALNAEMTTLNTVTLPALEADLGIAQADIDALESVTIPALNTRLTAAEADVSTLETVTIPGLNTSITNLNTSLDTLGGRVTTTESQISTLNNTTIPALNTSISTAQGQINTLNNTTIPALNTRLTTAEGDINTLETVTIPALNTSLATANTEIANRVKVRFDNTQPTGLLSTDRVIWYEADNGYTASYWNGTAWSPYQLSGAAILPGGIVTSHITSNTLNADRILAGSIVTDKMTANTINGDRVTANTLNASKIVAGSIATDRMTANTIDGDRITANTLNAAKIIAGTITTDRMTANTINGDRVTANTLNADKIIANTITGDRIQANAIDVTKISVGDMTNYIADGDLSDSTFANWDSAGLTRVAPVGTTPGYIEWATNATGNAHRYNKYRFELAPGDQFYFTCEVSTPATNTFSVNIAAAIQTYDATGTTVTWPQIGTTLAPNAGWTAFSGTITISAGNSVQGVFDPFSNATDHAGQVIRMRKMVLRKKNTGELIVDGSILTNHMTSNTINGDRITANTLNAAKIIAGTITTDRMTANTIDGSVITANTLNAAKIVAGSITTDRFTSDTINGNIITGNTLNASKIVAGSIGTDRMTANTINADRLLANSVTADKVSVGVRNASILQNSDMEIPITGGTGLLGWQVLWGWDNGTMTAETAAPITGTRSMKITTTATASGEVIGDQGSEFPVMPGQRIYVRVTIKALTAIAATREFRVYGYSCIASGTVTPFSIFTADAGATLPVGNAEYIGAWTAGTTRTLEGVWTVPTPNRVRGNVGLRLDGTGGIGEVFLVDSFECWPAVTNEQITTIDGGKIITNSIQASSLSVLAGGGNLMANSSFEDPTNRLSGWAKYDNAGVATLDVAVDGRRTFNAARLTWSTTSASMVGLYRTPVGNWKANQPYMVSFWAKAGNAGAVGATMSLASNAPAMTYSWVSNPSLTTTYQRYIASYSRAADTSDPLYFGVANNFGTNGVQKIVIFDDVQVEEGQLATAYSPKTDEILPGTIVADMIETYALTGKLIRTAASGKRLEIMGDVTDPSKITFYSGNAGEINPAQIYASSSSYQLILNSGRSASGQSCMLVLGPTLATLTCQTANGQLQLGAGNSTDYLDFHQGGNPSVLLSSSGNMAIMASGSLNLYSGAWSWTFNSAGSFSSYGTSIDFGNSSARMYQTNINREMAIGGTGIYSTEGSWSIGCEVYGNLVQWSDVRDKSNLKKVEGPLADIRKLPVYDYDTPHGGAGKEGEPNGLVRKRGITAQDFKKIAPHLIHDETDDPTTGFGMGVDVYGLLATTLAGLQELDQKVTQLEGKIK